MAQTRLTYHNGAACENCGNDATGMDIVHRRYVPTCDDCHEQIRLEAEADAEIDSREEESSCAE